MRNKIITYVEDECSNLNTLTNVLKYVVKCEASCLEENFQRIVFVMFFSKLANMLSLMRKFVGA